MIAGNADTKGEKRVAGFFTTFDIRLTDYSDEIWLTLAPLGYYSAILDCVIEVPTFFYTDLASVPRVPIAYRFWGGKAHREGVLHDFLYRIDSKPCVTMAQANAVFKEAMLSRGKSCWIRNPMYWGVCLGGKGSYHKRYVKEQLK